MMVAPLFGITTCNVPVGSKDFVEGYLNQQLERIEKGNRKIKSLLDPGRWPHPEIPTRQMLWILTLVCCQHRGDYWLRHVRPDWTESFARGIDGGIQSLFETCAGISLDTWSDYAKERIRLPIRYKGLRALRCC